MRTVRYLCMMLAGLFVMAACNKKDEAVDTSPEGTNKKTVAINLSGILTKPISKAISGKSTASAINLRDIKILLTNGSSIYKEVLFATGSPEFDSAVIGTNGYIFHEVDPAINKVIVLGNTSGEAIDYTNVASIKASIMKAEVEQDMTNVLLYGEGTLIASTEPSPIPHLGSTDYYTSTVNLSPLVSRLEIGKIQCSDLGTNYISFKLGGIGLIDFALQCNIGRTVFSDVLSIYNGTTGMISETGHPAPPGGYEFGVSGPIQWAYDQITSMPLFDEAADVYYANNDPTKVFGYSFIPIIGAFPNVKLHLAEVIAQETTSFEWVSTKTFNGLDLSQHPKPGYVYQFDFVFQEANIGPYDPDAKICVGVNVTVDQWVIQSLTPVFY